MYYDTKSIIAVALIIVLGLVTTNCDVDDPDTSELSEENDLGEKLELGDDFELNQEFETDQKSEANQENESSKEVDIVEKIDPGKEIELNEVSEEEALSLGPVVDASLNKDGWLCSRGRPVFEDEFNSMNWGAWSMKCTAGMVREAECRKQNVFVHGGELNIRTKRIGNSNKFTSAGIVSKVAYLTEGRTVCIEAKLPGKAGAGRGLWPALWFMPTRGECWPAGGEIDLMEMIDGNGQVHNTFHYVKGHVNGVTKPICGFSDRKGELSYTSRPSKTYYEKYHEYALKMTKDTIIYYLDGKETFRVRNGDQQAHIDTATKWIIQMNTAVGGNWPKPADSTTVNDTSFKIRSVRVVESADDRSNIARGKTAHQSSTAEGGVASRAVDGNNNGNFKYSSTTHTQYQSKPWWMVDLGKEYDIAQVSIFNRKDCCGERLRDYDVEYLDGNQHFIESLHYPGEQRLVKHHVLNVHGVRYVRIKLRGKGVLSLAEVQIYPTNLALGKTASQSSTAMGGAASRAVDGNTNGCWGYNSTTHTGNESSPWWMVDLGKKRNIARVSIFNRTDCCSSRLRNYNVEYLDANQKVIDSVHYAGEQGDVAHHVYFVPDVRYVRVALKEPGVLSLAEVQVFSDRTNDASFDDNNTSPGDEILTHGSEVNYYLGGRVQGLTGGNLVLREKLSGREIVVNTNGRFSFGQRFPEGFHYDVDIVSSPSISICSIEHDQDHMPATDNHGVRIDCERVGITVALSDSNGQSSCVNFGNNGTADYPTRYNWGAGGLCGFPDSNKNGSNHDELLANGQAVFRVVRLEGGDNEYVLINESERLNQCVNFGNNGTDAHPSRYNWNGDAGDLCGFPDVNKNGSNHDDLLANRQAVFKFVPLDGGDNEYVLINESQGANRCVNFGNNGTDAHPSLYNWGSKGLCGFPDINKNGSNHDDILANGQAVFKMHQIFATPTDTDGDGTPDREDLCPYDPWKTSAGDCGCGAFDNDTDGDGIPDCDDGCPADPWKTSAGDCGCGTFDTDTDGDGTPDCYGGPSAFNIVLSNSNGQVNCVNFGNNGTDAYPTRYNWCAGGLCGFPDINKNGSNHDDLLANGQAVLRAVRLEGGDNEYVLVNESQGANQCVNFGNNGTDAHPSRYNWGHKGLCGFPDINKNGSNHDDLLANRQAVFKFVRLDGGDDEYVLINESQSANQCVNFGNNGTDANPSRYNWGAGGLCGFPDANNNGSNHDDILANGQAVFKMHKLPTADDTDTDGDGTPDLVDGCPTDSRKTSEDVCGCGVPDTDTDGDGTLDCNDGCPADPQKTSEGVCGCGVPDTDTDGDGTPECDDAPSDLNIALSFNGQVNCLNFGNNGTAAYPTRYNWGAGGLCGFPDSNKNGSNHDELLANRQAVFRAVRLEGGNNEFVLINESKGANQCLNFGNNGTDAHPSRYNWGSIGLCGFPDSNKNGSNHDDLLANRQAVFRFVPLDGGDNNYVLINESKGANQCLNFGNNGTDAHPTRYNWGHKGLCGFPDSNKNGSNHDDILANGQAVFEMHELVVD